jgi:hypothetical protein
MCGRSQHGRPRGDRRRALLGNACAHDTTEDAGRPASPSLPRRPRPDGLSRITLGVPNRVGRNGRSERKLLCVGWVSRLIGLVACAAGAGADLCHSLFGLSLGPYDGGLPGSRAKLRLHCHRRAARRGLPSRHHAECSPWPNSSPALAQCEPGLCRMQARHNAVVAPQPSRCHAGNARPSSAWPCTAVAVFR